MSPTEASVHPVRGAMVDDHMFRAAGRGDMGLAGSLLIGVLSAAAAAEAESGSGHQ
jgi:hypothetical protein